VRKKIISFILVLTLVFGWFPFMNSNAYAVASHVMRVRVEGAEKTHYDRKVTVTEEVYCQDYLNSLGHSISDGWITTLFDETPDWDTNKDCWMNYYVKDNVIHDDKSVAQYKLNEADEIVVYVANFNGNGTLIPVISVDKEDEQAAITVQGKSRSAINPVEGVNIKVSYMTDKITNSNGKITFDIKGIHKVKIGDYPGLVRKTVYVGEKNILQTVTDAVYGLKEHFNNKSTFDPWEASAYYLVGETDEELQQIVDKYSNEITETSGAGAVAQHIIGLLAAGKDPRNIEGEDYVAILKNSQQTSGKFIKESGDDAWIGNQAFGVLALDLVEEGYDVNKAMEALISYQDPDGSFGWGVDDTAMTLFAFANHRSVEGVEQAIQSALTYIKDQQLNTGGFPGCSGEASESSAMVIKALVDLGINPLSDEWTNNGNSILDALLAFKQGNQFKSTSDGDVNDISTKQAFSALVDLYNGESMYKAFKPHVHEDYKIDMGIGVQSEYEFTLTRNGSSSFQKGEEAQLNATVINNSDSNQQVTYIVALYKLDGASRQLYAYTFMTKTIDAGALEELAGGFLIPSTGSYEVKAMLWDDFDNKQPLAESITVDVE